MEFEKFADKYLLDLKKCIDEIDLKSLDTIKNMLTTAYKKGNKIYILGNGGSATTASHFACDLSKGTVKSGDNKRFKVVSLSDNVSTITAIGNDLAYEDIFVEQLKNLVEKDDIVIGISASGNSPNVIKAIEYGNTIGAKTIGFIGFDGGKLKGVTKTHVIVPSFHYGISEDIHLIMEHIICYFLKEYK